MQHHQLPHGMNSGDVRLAQAYLKVMGYFGPADTIEGHDVVTGHIGPLTKHAFAKFGHDHHLSATFGPPLAHAITHAGKAYIHRLETPHHLSAVARAQDDMHRMERSALALVYKHHHAAEPGLNHLHPLLRLPALEAIHALHHKGIHFAIGHQDRNQETMVREGRSAAAPGSSYHEYGLALDVVPVGKDGKVITDADDPSWDKIRTVMHHYGFASIGAWDAPHYEIKSKTSDMLRWPKSSDGWKNIPDSAIPPIWRSINAASIRQDHHHHHGLGAHVAQATPSLHAVLPR